KSDLEAVKAEYKAKENSVLFDVNDAYARVEANKKLVELYETSFIPEAEEAANVSSKGYETSKTDLTDFLESQSMLIKFKEEHYKAIADLRNALADLETAVGCDIE
ncbi:MAG: TolC family protein, partial [Candidatus Omnitrophica bacterium]|nr:TolC family protein [Candidatus Omnitrophota bacterium]